MILADSATTPEMIVVAGAPGSGKSTLFPVRAFGVDFFNADDAAAARNGGSYHSIPRSIRSAVNRDLELWVQEHISSRRSFAVETTLRSDIALQQAALAAEAGFRVMMIYVALNSFELNLERVRARAHNGGHSASEGTLRDIYEGSFQTLTKAVALCGTVIARFELFDNSVFDSHAKLLLRIDSHRNVEQLQKLPANLHPYFASMLSS